MEASEALGATGAQEAAPAQTAPEGGEGTQTETQSPQIAEQLLERFDGFRNDVTERFGALEQRLPEPAQQQEPEQRLMRDELTGELYDANTGQMVDENAIREQQFMSKVQDLVSPLQERLQQAEGQLADYEMGGVMDEFPALEDPQIAEPFMAQVTQTAQQMGAPQLAANPDFVRSQWLAKLGAERAAQETPAGGPVSEGSVETGAASVPQPPEDLAKAILDNARGGGSDRARQFFSS